MRRCSVLVSLVLLLAGCVTVQPSARLAPGGGERARSQPARGDAVTWPERWGDETPGVGKGVVVPVEGPLSAWEPIRHGPWHHRVPKENDLEIVRELAAGRAEGGYRFRMEGFGAYVFERDPDVPPPEGEARDRDEPAFMFVFASGRPAGKGADEPHVDIERTWFAYYEHRRGGSPDADDPGEGVVMLLPGLFGVPEQVMEIMVSTMRQAGWNVVRMLAPPSRFVERSDIRLDPSEPTTAREVADELMHRVAETAYAAEAAMAYVLEKRPGLADHPRAIVGGSAGALALPATVKRDEGRYDAAVVIAGGTNILDVVARSTYTEPVSALDFEWIGYGENGAPDRETLDRFTAQYLVHAPLDAAHAASAMTDIPVLVLHASGDRAVPADAGERLWRALGEPERWVINGNHMTLFLSLWMYTPRILDWLDEHAAGEGGNSP